MPFLSGGESPPHVNGEGSQFAGDLQCGQPKSKPIGRRPDTGTGLGVRMVCRECFMKVRDGGRVPGQSWKSVGNERHQSGPLHLEASPFGHRDFGRSQQADATVWFGNAMGWDVRNASSGPDADDARGVTGFVEGADDVAGNGKSGARPRTVGSLVSLDHFFMGECVYRVCPGAVRKAGQESRCCESDEPGSFGGPKISPRLRCCRRVHF